MNWIKTALLTSTGVVSRLLLYALLGLLWAINLLPMVILDFPTWLFFVVGAILWFVPIVQIPYLGIWIWALVVALGRPITWISIVFFIAFVVYFGNMIINTFFGRHTSE